MKKIFKTLPLALVVMSIISCSSDENVGQELKDSQTKIITFTCTQEQDESATKAGLSADAKKIFWKSGDKISIFDGTNNNEFTLKNESAGNKSGAFTGTCNEVASYVAVYPYTEGATLSEDGETVINIELPATQKAVKDSFDPNASLMMAKSNTKELSFKNAVGWIKVKTDFTCSKIELRAPGELTYIAGKGTLSYNKGTPTIEFTSEKSRTITLVPADGQETIAAGTYYIVVPAVNLYAGWRITFTDASDSKEYVRRGSKEITFKRKTIIDLGEFKTGGDYWLDPVRGIVKANQEVDMDVNVTIGSTTYKVIFAKTNLTATGLAENESDYGDYFAWGALEPWCTAYTRTTTEVTPTAWKTDKSGGYSQANAPYSSGPSYTKYTAGNTLDADDNAARQILGGDWQLPTTDIWQALKNTENYDWTWTTTQDGYSGLKVTSKTDNSKSIFLPAAGDVYDTTFEKVGSDGHYWSGTVNSNMKAHSLHFLGGYFYPVDSYFRSFGFSVRPVRLVAE